MDGFKIGEGFVDVKAKLDKKQIDAESFAAGTSAGHGIRKGLDDDGTKNRGRFTGILRKMLTPTSEGFAGLTKPLTAALSSPIGMAAGTAGATFALSFIGAVLAAGIPIAIGGAFLGIGALALKDNPKIQKGFESLSKRVKKSLTGAAAPLVGPFTKAMDIVGDSIERMAPTLKGIFTTLAPVVEPLTKGLTGFGENLLKGLGESMPGFAEIMKTFAAELPDLGTTIGGFFKTLADNAPAISNALSVIFTIIQNMISVIGPVLVFWAKGITFWADVWNSVTGGLKKAWDWIENTAVPNIGKFFTITIPGWVETARKWFSGLGGKIGTALSNLRSSITSPFTNGFNSARSAVSTGINNAIALVRGIGGKVKGALSGAGSWLRDAGRRIINGLIEGINSALGSLRSTLSRVTNLIPDWKGPEDVDRKLLVPAGKAIMGGLQAGIDSEVPSLQSQLQGITNSVPRMATPSQSVSNSTTFGNVQVIVKGILDPSDPMSYRRMIAELLAALKGYEKGYA